MEEEGGVSNDSADDESTRGDPASCRAARPAWSSDVEMKEDPSSVCERSKLGGICCDSEDEEPVSASRYTVGICSRGLGPRKSSAEEKLLSSKSSDT